MFKRGGKAKGVFYLHQENSIPELLHQQLYCSLPSFSITRQELR
jgi:hypothetical protein